MEWSEVIEDETLQNLPFKIELNEWGNIVMSPASNMHSILQGIISSLLNDAKRGGLVFPECSVGTSKGVKVADVAWVSDRFLAGHGAETPYNVAPELCIEVISPSNSKAEIAEKRDLYLAKGAKEFWTCSEEGRMTFYDPSGEIATSNLFTDFPRVVETDLPSA